MFCTGERYPVERKVKKYNFLRNISHINRVSQINRWDFWWMAYYYMSNNHMSPCWLLTYKLRAVFTIFIFISANTFFNLLRIREVKVFFTKFRRHHGKFYKKTDEEPYFTLSTKAYPYDCNIFLNIIFTLFLLT